MYLKKKKGLHSKIKYNILKCVNNTRENKTGRNKARRGEKRRRKKLQTSGEDGRGKRGEAEQRLTRVVAYVSNVRR